jgi:hypothetical protein
MFVVGFPIVAMLHTRYFSSLHFKTQRKNIIKLYMIKFLTKKWNVLKRPSKILVKVFVQDIEVYFVQDMEMYTRPQTYPTPNLAS